VKDPEGPLFSVTWTPPDNRGVDVDKLKGGILAHIPGAKFKDFFVGRGRGGLGNLKEASAPYVMLSRGRDGCIAKFTSPEITDGRVATWYDNPPEKQFAAALAAAKVQLRENDQAALDRLLKGEQKELALFGYPLRIRYGETANGSLIVESIATEGRSE
jgi:hypothetical protein